ncbi:MAG: nitroreductase family protein [Pseudomonadota bacterium]
MNSSTTDLRPLIDARYSDAPEHMADLSGTDMVRTMLKRGSCRDFLDKPVPANVLDLLCAAALASPTKSDLQQRDIILLKSPSVRQDLAALVSGQHWVGTAPMIALFCGNNRRQRLLHDWHNVPFANDHLDAFFNAAADAAIALGAFVTAADSLGLGCCPISAVRNKASEVSDLLGLPDHVFPLAGLAIGYPRRPPEISMRLPLSVTCHIDRYREDDLRAAVQTYDNDRASRQPYDSQRFPELFGEKVPYTWSDDKVQQYSQAERADFGGFVRAKGFRLD